MKNNMNEVDSLTGGLNRKGFIQQVQRILQDDAETTEYEILFFNIRNFKVLNELFGIEYGDEFLRWFYKELLDAEFQPQVTARIETDHFACLTRRSTTSYEYIEKFCCQNMERDGKMFQIHVWCGIVPVTDNEMTVSGLLDRARLANRNVSEKSGQHYAVYTLEMKDIYMNQAEVLAEFEYNMVQGAFVVYYQPVVDVENGKLASAEALVRWLHPQKGIIYPGEFISLLEKRGTISKLDIYVLEQVLQFQRQRQQAGKTVVPISVNLSGEDLCDVEMRQKIMEVAEAKEGFVCFEITETSYISMDRECLEFIRYMREHGLKIAVDDFGKGYSSLGLLHNCEVDTLKIDMEFVQQVENNPRGQIILRAIIDMAHRLGLQTVAEGVETKAQWEFLQECGCINAQGYYFSKPIPPEKFVDFVDGNEAYMF